MRERARNDQVGVPRFKGGAGKNPERARNDQRAHDARWSDGEQVAQRGDAVAAGEQGGKASQDLGQQVNQVEIACVFRDDARIPEAVTNPHHAAQKTDDAPLAHPVDVRKGPCRGEADQAEDEAEEPQADQRGVQVEHQGPLLIFLF